MGLSFISSCSSLRCDNKTISNIDPNPLNFNIGKLYKNGKWLLAEIRYPNCTNFEGIKIILFEGLSIEQLKNKTYLDPHFSNTGNIFARFKPTKEGWLSGIFFVDQLSKLENNS